MTEQQLDRIKEIHDGPAWAEKTTRKAYERGGLSAAVKAKCMDCSCWQRAEIANCTVETCPLWAYRPYAEHPGRNKRIISESQLEAAKARGRRLGEARKQLAAKGKENNQSAQYL